MGAALAYLIGSLGCALLGVGAWVRTPDPDRRRAYPSQPDRWLGVTGEPASLRHAVGTRLFYLPGLAVAGAVLSALRLWMPVHGPVALSVAGAAGAAASFLCAARLLRFGPGAMRAQPRSSKRPPTRRPRVLFVCGSQNQTTQMHQIALELPAVESWFTPYYSDHWSARLLLRLGALERAILGFGRRGRCLDYLNANGLAVDLCGEENVYDLCVTCNDQVLPEALKSAPWVLVQEGIQEPLNWRARLWRWARIVPTPLTGTATFGLSNGYTRFCVASEGYRERYLAEGIPSDKIVVTGIPNFDDFARYRNNAFPYRGYVLVCTSDARETWLAADRSALLRRAVAIAAGRPLFFKLHPNERVDRATREIREVAPDARIFSTGSAEEMVANCEVLVTEWSSVTFCGVALGKEVHSLHALDEVRALLPIQNGCAAREIAGVVHGLLTALGRAEGPSADAPREVAQ